MYCVKVYDNYNMIGKQFFDTRPIAEGYAWRYDRRGYDTVIIYMTNEEYSRCDIDHTLMALT